MASWHGVAPSRSGASRRGGPRACSRPAWSAPRQRLREASRSGDERATSDERRIERTVQQSQSTLRGHTSPPRGHTVTETRTDISTCYQSARAWHHGAPPRHHPRRAIQDWPRRTTAMALSFHRRQACRVGSSALPNDEHSLAQYMINSGKGGTLGDRRLEIQRSEISVDVLEFGHASEFLYDSHSDDDDDVASRDLACQTRARSLPSCQASSSGGALQIARAPGPPIPRRRDPVAREEATCEEQGSIHDGEEPARRADQAPA